MALSTFFKELSKRNVIRASLSYLAISWLILQVSSIVVPALNFPESSIKILLVILLVLFPFWIVFSWIYDLTPKGFIKTSEIKDIEEVNQKTKKNLNTVIIVGLSLAVIILLLDRVLGISERILMKEELSIAVLPFDNLSGEKQQDYYASGMQDELITRLALLENFRVISKTSTLMFKNKTRNIMDVSESLDVDLVIEGSLMKYEDSVRIQVQLIDIREEENHLWSKYYDKSISQVLDMHAEVTSDIAKSVNIVLSDEDLSELSTEKEVNPAAYDALSKAKFNMLQFTPESIQRAIQYTNQAIEIDPNYSQAFAHLSYIGGFMAVMGVLPPVQAGEMQLLNARKAFEIDNQSDAAISAMASVHTWYLWDWEKAEKYWKKAIELNNSDPIMFMYYGHFLACMGRFEEAKQMGAIAVKLDPFNPFLFGLYSIMFMHSGNYDKALEVAQKSIDMDPNNPFAVGAASLISYGKGDLQGTYKYYKQKVSMSRDTTQLKIIENAYEIGGPKQALNSAANYLAEKSKKMKRIKYRTIGFLYDQSGDIENAISWLQKSYDAHEVGMVYLRNTPVSKELYDHKEFQALQDSMHFQLSPERH